jgi:hypothetical protein
LIIFACYNKIKELQQASDDMEGCRKFPGNFQGVCPHLEWGDFGFVCTYLKKTSERLDECI